MRERMVQRLVQVVGLSEREATHVVNEVLDICDETVDEYISSRHLELQREGLKTDAIYRRIHRELEEWRFKAPDFSIRQIRRRIYG